jgi:hypothetical protein
MAQILVLVVILGLFSGLIKAHHKLSPEEERLFLNALGLESPPLLERQEKNIQIPQWMRDLYQQQSGLEAPETVFKLPGAHVGASNTARTFHARPISGCGGADPACLLAFKVSTSQKVVA